MAEHDAGQRLDLDILHRFALDLREISDLGLGELDVLDVTRRQLGYAAPSSPEFREKQLERFRELAPEIDIVITTALIPGRPAPKLWLKDMVEAMKPGSLIVDLAAERGGNCDLTVPDEKIVTDNGVTIIGFTDYPSRMATQASTLYGNNIRHMKADLTPKKDGVVVYNMEDDVIRGATVAYEGEVTFPPPPPKVKAIAAQKPRPKEKEATPDEKRAAEAIAFRRATRYQVALLAVGTVTMLLLGYVAPPSFMDHLIVFALACFVGFQVIWNVSHALHTPLWRQPTRSRGSLSSERFSSSGPAIGWCWCSAR